MRGEEREVWRRTGKGDRPASAYAPPPARTLGGEKMRERERRKERREKERGKRRGRCDD